MRYVLILVLVVMGSLGMAGYAFSEEESRPEAAANEFVGGLQETVVGSVQVPAKMAETGKENPIAAVTVAPVQGAKETALKTTEGALRAGTAILPPYEKREDLPEAQGRNFGERFGEGLKETALGAVQVPVEMAEAAKENPAKAITIAPIEGAKKTILQTTEGSLETATSFVPEESTSTSHSQ
ncbi:MAG: hypothetical protein HY590_07865 [Candidatus Omnitrophica bacterium]|nr:hypothetical protein [Candidatus Omnitrophota bacterium]